MPKVSIVIPTKNEARHLPSVIDSLLSQDFPSEEMEILIVDGRSTDNTRDIVEQYHRKYNFVHLIDNPKGYTPFAFNAGIRNAKGEIIFFMSAHTYYSKNFISTVVKYISEGKAECVGSIANTLPGDDTLIAEAIALVLSSPFGVGNSYMRIGHDSLRYVDTAGCSGYKKEVFEKIGFFNEKLIYSQDIELNHRLRKAGMRILLVPDIISNYYARPDYWSFCKHNFRNGLWSILPFRHSKIIPLSLRHLIPLAFVASLIGSLALASLSHIFLQLFLIISGAYICANLIYTVKIFLKSKKIKHLIIVPFIFASLHIVYGAGSFWGVIKLLIKSPE